AAIGFAAAVTAIGLAAAGAAARTAATGRAATTAGGGSTIAVTIIAALFFSATTVAFKKEKHGFAALFFPVYRRRYRFVSMKRIR
ncbi:MAG: hypothetical protein WBH14_12560, partial [Albidovulum sp.]